MIVSKKTWHSGYRRIEWEEHEDGSHTALTYTQTVTHVEWIITWNARFNIAMVEGYLTGVPKNPEYAYRWAAPTIDKAKTAVADLMRIYDWI